MPKGILDGPSLSGRRGVRPLGPDDPCHLAPAYRQGFGGGSGRQGGGLPPPPPGRGRELVGRPQGAGHHRPGRHGAAALEAGDAGEPVITKGLAYLEQFVDPKGGLAEAPTPTTRPRSP